MTGMRAFSDSEIRAMRGGLAVRPSGNRDQALFVLGIDTGFRISELLSIRIRDLVMHGDVVDELVIERRNMKGKLEGRKAELFDETKDALRPWLLDLGKRGYRRPIDFVFQDRTASNRAIRPGAAWRIIKTTAAGLRIPGPIGTHSLRKTYALKIYEYCKRRQAAGVPLDPVAVVQDALGHSERKTTERYLELRTRNIRPLIRSAITGARR